VRLLVLAAVVAVGAVGAVVWTQVATSDSKPDAVLDEPGEYGEPTGTTNPPLPTRQLPAVTLTAASGASTELAPDGRPMVVNLWFSTCAPCAQELADFATVHGEVGDAVRFVGVDPIDTSGAMTRFAADRHVAYELLRDPGEHLGQALDVAVYPVTLFVAADGTILDESGPITADTLRSRIRELFS
jgi:cytochrome oxidase Cu insertion factor (SCO1/SenC/PrrC family)